MKAPNKDMIAISTIYRKMNVWENKQSAPYGLSAAQVPIINIVCRNPGISQNEVVEMLALEKSVVAKSIGKLVEYGYLAREQNQKDKRAFNLFPTEKAMTVYPSLIEQGQQCMELLTTGLSNKEIATLSILLEKLAINSKIIFENK